MKSCTRAASMMRITVYPPERQGSGSFDEGKITEIKPIDFPGGTSEAKRIGPLFYWAWASANGDGIIGMHPHKGFEIMSYVLKGELGHTDTLGGKRRVGTGGAQVMQTGSGVFHQEEMFGERTEFFQIWFEPDLREALRREPTYRDFVDEDFPVSETEGLRIKKIIGEDAPISIVADARMDDVTIQAGKAYQRRLGSERSLAAVSVKGDGKWLDDQNGLETAFQETDFSVIEATDDTTISVQAGTGRKLRLVMIEIPKRVDYPVYG